MDTTRILEEFPAPEFRGAQRAALADVRAAFEAGNDVVLVSAPTGSGKSLLARAVAGCARRAGEADPADPIGAYYTTPQVSQLDDVAGDPLLEDLRVIRGKSNYDCILPGETDTPVDRAPCARERGFDCPVKHRCPYFSDRAIASNQPIAAMTLAYFMQTAGSDVFGQRDVVVVDEAHGLAEWAEMYATIELSPSTVPVWDACEPPAIDGLADVEDYAERLTAVCQRRQEELRGRTELTPSEVEERDRLAELVRDLGWLLEDLRDPESPTTWIPDQATGSAADPTSGEGSDPRGGAITVKPMDPALYLHHTVWDRGTKFALLSATILDKQAFCRGAGLDPSDVALVDVPHTFPVEHRPIYDVTQGKMTYEHRDDTLPDVARTIVRLMAKHDDEKGLVHAHSYEIADRLRSLLGEFGVADRVRSHDRDTRDAALANWKRRDDPDVFVAVTMEEALDLEGELCRWQVLCKAPYPNTNDSRVARRLEDDQWAWYYRSALRTVIQACGRLVRSPADHGATYLADRSLLDLFDRARTDMPDWFAAQVDRMTEPDLPAADPEAALGEAAPTAASSLGAGRNAPSGHRPESASTTGHGDATTAGTTSDRPNTDGPDAGEADDDAASIEDHPLTDVWGDG